jgi:hypothetical protein
MIRYNDALLMFGGETSSVDIFFGGLWEFQAADVFDAPNWREIAVLPEVLAGNTTGMSFASLVLLPHNRYKDTCALLY